MKVDISPNFPPNNSWTAAAELGDGLFGWGSSVWSLSKRVITDDFLSYRMAVSWRQPKSDRGPDGGLGPNQLLDPAGLDHVFVLTVPAK